MVQPDSSDISYPAESLFYRRHQINLLAPSLISLGMLLGVWAMLILLFTNSAFDLSAYWSYFILFIGLTLFFVMSYFLMQWVFWYFDIWVVTREKLIDSQLVTFFLLNRAELPLRQIQDISYSTSGLLATLFRCGDITIQTASKQGSFKLLSIYQPQEAVKAIEALVDQATSELYGSHEFTYLPVTVKLGELLVGRNLISHQHLAAALAEQQVSHERLGRILLHQGLITKQDLLGALSAQYHIPQIDLTYYEIDPQVVYCLMPQVVHKYNIIPVFKTPNGVLEIAVSQLSEELVQDVRNACGSPIFFVLADEEIIQALIQKYYSNPLSPEIRSPQL